MIERKDSHFVKGASEAMPVEVASSAEPGVVGDTFDSSESQIQVSVICPCRNEGEYIRSFLECLLNQVVTFRCEFLIADGESDDGTFEILRDWVESHPSFRIVPNPGRIVSTGLNAAIRSAKGEFIVRMDVHSDYAPDYIESCVSELIRTGATNVGGPAVSGPTDLTDWVSEAISVAYGSPFSCGGARFHDVSFEGYVDTVTYGCWRRGVFAEYGMFDESLVRNQDDEFNLRIVRGGGRIWQSPRIRLWYYPRRSLRGLIRQYFQYGFWKVAVIKKHRTAASWRHLVPAGGMLVNIIALAALGICAMTKFRSTASLLGLAMLLEVAIYGALAATFAAIATTRHFRAKLIMPYVFMLYHVSYGAGFLMGMLQRSRGKYPDLSQPYSSGVDNIVTRLDRN